MEISLTIRSILYKTMDNKEKFFEIPQKQHYFKHYLIQEVSGLGMLTDTFGRDTAWLTIEPPVLLDLKSMDYYRFSSFSDTSHISYQYSKSDTSRFGIPVQPDKVLEYQKTRGKLFTERKADTVINNVNLRQYVVTGSFQRNGVTTEHRRVMFFRCDIDTFPYSLDKPLEKEVGCTCVRSDLPGMSAVIDVPAERVSKKNKRIIRSMIKKTKKYKGNPPDKKQGLNWIN